MQTSVLKNKKPIVIGAAALMASVLGSASLAQEFSGASFELMTTIGSENSTSILHGDVAFDMGNGLGVQLGAAFKAGDGYDEISAFEAHVSQDLGNNLTFGGFVGQETWDGDSYRYSGIEVVLKQSALTIELSASNYQETDGEDVYRPVTLDLSYDMSEKLAIIAGYADDTSSNDDDTFSYVGVEYDVAPNVVVATTYGHDKSWGEGTIGVGVKINFAKGVQMRQRNYTSYFPHY